MTERTPEPVRRLEALVDDTDASRQVEWDDIISLLLTRYEVRQRLATPVLLDHETALVKFGGVTGPLFDCGGEGRFIVGTDHDNRDEFRVFPVTRARRGVRLEAMTAEPLATAPVPRDRDPRPVLADALRSDAWKELKRAAGVDSGRGGRMIPQVQYTDAQMRAVMLANLSGRRVLEVGCGNGRNFEHYPNVAHVHGIEPSHLAKDAMTQAWHHLLPRSIVTVDQATIERWTPPPDPQFDAVVVSRVLCTLPDPTAALELIKGWLRPGGFITFYEHVRSANGRAVAEVYEDAHFPDVRTGCHLSRQTLDTIEAAGFELRDDLVVSTFASAPGEPMVDHIAGSARLAWRS